MTMKTLRTSLPPEVWDRLDAEARESGVTLAAHVRALIVARDERRVSRNSPTP